VTALPPPLDRLGDALEQAAAADLAAAASRRGRRRLVLAATAVVIAVPGAAIAADRLIQDEDVARSMPAGALIFAEQTPTCETVREDVEYRCVLQHSPDFWTPEQQGAVYQTVDATQHVNGGCRNTSADGLTWSCYVGQEAVRQGIIGPDFLGEVQTMPSVG
jgi:hypothetical protein